MRGDVKSPLGGNVGMFASQAAGVPLRSGAWKEEGVTWQQIQQDKKRVKREEYERKQRKDLVYNADSEEVLSWYIKGMPVRSEYTRKLYNELGMPYTFWADQNKGAIRRQQQIEWEKAVDDMDRKGTL